MDAIIQRWGPFDVDLFCDRPGLTARAPVWYFRESSAFEVTSLVGKIWAFPPRHIAGQALAHINNMLHSGCSALFALVLLEEPGAPWFWPTNLRRWRRRGRWAAGANVLVRPCVLPSVTRDTPPRVRWAKVPLDLPLLLLTSW